MLEISGVRAGYGSMTVLQGVDMSIKAGEIVALLGSNGVGKTTLNNVISGFIRPNAGTLTFKGVPLTGKKPADIVALGIAHVPEGRKIFPNLSVAENLSLGAFRRAGANRKQNFERICAIFPKLRQRLNQSAGTLSGGEQQMLAIGRGLMSEPELLILDEPSLGLSPIMVEEMFNLITKINAEGVAILLVEQNVMQSLAVAGRAYVIEQGRFVMEGAAADLISDKQLRQAYLGM
ncbi:MULTISPECIES: ABC transporter ATP-binding protein [unclassified Rhizobium]|uniref:ABC transporter ATP-binding protein n=1 Tax=unclassified Rhizobium TaxID=2613769 RepID=UPI001E59BF80|nr:MULTISPECIES: ABC transporter ATP-binding protein [unclassified Rhizobium]MCD2174990.1 ABC transporter ATP-binding protein [Rhizobium sp. C4]MCD2178609.1 ABC transporter ATP-binding protein [Rhizobium sp. C1]